MTLGLILVPAALVGVVAARWGAQRLPAEGVRYAVLGLSSLSALAAIARGLS